MDWGTLRLSSWKLEAVIQMLQCLNGCNGMALVSGLAGQENTSSLKWLSVKPVRLGSIWVLEWNLLQYRFCFIHFASIFLPWEVLPLILNFLLDILFNYVVTNFMLCPITLPVVVDTEVPPVAKHNTSTSCWVILYGNVYDVSAKDEYVIQTEACRLPNFFLNILVAAK